MGTRALILHRPHMGDRGREVRAPLLTCRLRHHSYTSVQKKGLYTKNIKLYLSRRSSSFQQQQPLHSYRSIAEMWVKTSKKKKRAKTCEELVMPLRKWEEDTLTSVVTKHVRAFRVFVTCRETPFMPKKRAKNISHKCECILSFLSFSCGPA